MKMCVKCKQIKQFDEFTKCTANKKDGYHLWCKVCSRAYIEDNKEARRSAVLKAYYGITKEDYEKLIQEQNGKCLGCGKTERLGIDHCHITRQVRGLLCFHCNSILGMANDSESVLKNLLQYLTSYQERLKWLKQSKPVYQSLRRVGWRKIKSPA